MHFILFLFILMVFLGGIFFEEVYADNSICSWEIQYLKDTVGLEEINQKKYFNLEKWSKDLFSIQCMSEPAIDLENNLISLEFQIESENKPELPFSLNTDDESMKIKFDNKSEMSVLLIDYNQNRIILSSVMEVYDISNDLKVNLVLDPKDFENLDNKFSYDQVREIELILDPNNISIFEISDPQIITLNEYSNYKISDNLPVQSTIPGIIVLIFISFPMGYVLLTRAGFFKEENFLVKLPWYLGFGFVFYLLVIFLVSWIWFSYETILAYLVIEIGILLFVLKNTKISKNFSSKESKKVFVLFLFLFCISGLVAGTFAEIHSWPQNSHDGVHHAIRIASIMHFGGLSNYDLTSYLPYSDIGGLDRYPPGAHVAAGGISFLSNLIPAETIISMFSFILILVIMMFTSLVFKFTKSLFFSVVAFMVLLWLPTSDAFFGDIIIGQWIKSNFSSQVGNLIILISLMINLSYFEKQNKIKIACLGVSVSSLAIVYYPYIALVLIIIILSFLTFEINKKRLLVIGGLAIVFGSNPLWRSILIELSKIRTFGGLSYHHFKYVTPFPFEPSNPMFGFWISSIIGCVLAAPLFREKKFRILSLSVLILGIIHLISISEILAVNYAFFHKALRSSGLMFYFLFSFNLIALNYFMEKFSGKFSSKIINKLRKNITKMGIIGIIFLFLLPGFQLWGEVFQPAQGFYNKIPGGNEREIQLWLYENAKSDDVILNDFSVAASWLAGFKAQHLINGEIQTNSIAQGKWIKKIESSSFQNYGSLETFNANMILIHPWDYERMSQTIKEFDINYIYISERRDYIERCSQGACYPTIFNLPWYNYSGDSRIAIYQNNPDLELVLRNGDSALFRVK